MKWLIAPRIQDLIFLGTLLFTGYLLIFHNLGKAQIRIWDEATYANNAIDMYENPGNPLVIKHQGEPDLYNVKPPLVIWLQALSMKIWGINEFAVRLPSALFGLLTVLLLYGFAYQVLESRLLGFFSGMILLSSSGFIRNHVVRTGDLDAALVFFLLLQLTAFWTLLLKDSTHKRPIYMLLCLGILGAFMSKGIAAFFFSPAMLIMAGLPFTYKVLKDVELYGWIFVCLLICGGYYGLRELSVPGYWPILRDSEFIRINTEVMSWHLQAADYYWQELRNKHFSHLIWGLLLIPLAFFTTPFRSKSFYFLLYACIALLAYFFLISYPPVKLSWYDAPLLPVLSLTLAFAACRIGEELGGRILAIFPRLKKIRAEYLLIPYLLFPYLLFPSYQNLWKDTRWAETHAFGLELEGAFLKHLSQIRPELQSIKIFKKEAYKEHYDPVLFYIRAFRQERKMGEIQLVVQPDFSSGDWVMLTKPEDIAEVDSLYSYSLKEEWQKALLVQVKEKF